ncbi:MAG: HAMP domain-containing protein [Chloroflexi bacterium]|nr:HAMP domain-containing protein [Chloroflexota bacterium]
MFKSLQWRIAASYVALVLVCMLLLSVYLLNLVRDHYLQNLELHLAAQARLVADNAETYLSSGRQSADLDELAKRLGRQTNARITLIDKNGVVRGDSHEDPAAMENHGTRPEVTQALASGLGEARRHSKTVGYDMIYVAVPIKMSGDNVGVARISLPLTEINRSVDSVTRAVVAGASMTAILAIVLALYLARATTRPVVALTRMAKSIAAGDLDQRIGVHTRDEIGELGRAFNHMGEQLKQTIGAISAERNRMAAILATLADGILIIDDQGKVTLMNAAAARILRTTESKAIGHSYVEVLRDHELVDLAQECLPRYGAEGQMYRGQDHTHGVAGNARVVEYGIPKRSVRAIATPVQDDRSAQVLLVLQDLTELRRLETVRREFIANVSHELRTPLASMKALVETLQESTVDDPVATRDFLSRMDVEVDGMTQLVRELLELSRIESGQASPRLRPTDVAALVKDPVERLRPQADRAGVELLLEVPCDIPPVQADAERIQQVLINLIHNGIKFTPAGGKVAISARRQDDHVTFAVADTGVGIPAEDLPRIFERFYKADRSRSSGGTGLGLAVAKHIVQAHNGSIWVESVEGQGATFIFTLRLFT